MKGFKKILALCLMAVLMMAMVPAGYAESIEITGSKEGTTYSAYKIFDLENVVDGAYSYKVVEDWKNFFVDSADGHKYIHVDDNGYPTVVEGLSEADKAAFAKEAVAWAKMQNIKATKTATAGADGKATFTDLERGYYAIDTTLGSLCILNTANGTLSITEKNEVPTIEKKVQSGTEWADGNIAKIGDTVSFKSTIKVGRGWSGFKFRDSMEEGLTLDSASIKVRIADTDTAESDDTYSKVMTGLSEGETFGIDFADSFIEKNAGKSIEIIYSATLNEKAKIDDANKNTATLQYGDKKTSDFTETKTLSFDLVKYYKSVASDGTVTNKWLAGAEFELYDAAEEGDKIELVKESDYVYRVAKSTGTETTVICDKIVSVDGHAIQIKGLDNRDYYLEEIKAPNKYNKLDGRVKVELSQGVSLISTAAGEAASTGGVQVENKSGTTLPSTGGIGTTVFYIVGGILMATAAVVLITKKRMEKNV